MFGVLAVIAFVIAWIFHAAGFHAGAVLDWTSFALAGLVLFSAHVAFGYVGPVIVHRRNPPVA